MIAITLPYWYCRHGRSGIDMSWVDFFAVFPPSMVASSFRLT